MLLGMNDLAVQLDASERNRGRTAPGGAVHVADISAAPETAWRFRPIQLLVVCGLLLGVAVVLRTAFGRRKSTTFELNA